MCIILQRHSVDSVNSEILLASGIYHNAHISLRKLPPPSLIQVGWVNDKSTEEPVTGGRRSGSEPPVIAAYGIGYPFALLKIHVSSARGNSQPRVLLSLSTDNIAARARGLMESKEDRGERKKWEEVQHRIH